MNILYKNRSSIGIRYSYSVLGIFLRLIPLTLFCIVTVVFALGRMNWVNWLIPVVFICIPLILSFNKTKAVYKKKRNQLITYPDVFHLKGIRYNLPACRNELTLHTQQRVDYSSGVSSTRPRIFYFTDILVKLSERLVELDSIPIQSTRDDEFKKQQALKDWEQFFDAIYNPDALQLIASGNTPYYWQIGMWVTLSVLGGFAFYLNMHAS